VALFLLALLLYVTVEPFLGRWARRFARRPAETAPRFGVEIASQAYRKILVPLDHTRIDRLAVAHAASIARAHSAKLYLLHVEEDVTSQMYGELASTAEVASGMQYLHDIAEDLRAQSIQVEAVVRHSSRPRQEIVAFAQELEPDLVVMGGHGHRGIQDLVFGSTIEGVRHELDVPLMIVREAGPSS
jgi:manganese transport protein